MEANQELALLRSVAEQLRTPLTVIARQAELFGLTYRTGEIGSLRGVKKNAEQHSSVDLAGRISAEAQTALTLVDTYLLGLQLLHEQQSLSLEPVSLSSTLHDVMQVLLPVAKQHNVEVDLILGGRYEPVMAHRRATEALFVNLALTFLGTIDTLQAPSRRLTLAVHRERLGIVAGVYSPLALSTGEWRRARTLGQSAARQSLPGVVNGSGAGILVADALSRAMESELRVGRYARQTGLAMCFMPSQQLQLV